MKFTVRQKNKLQKAIKHWKDDILVWLEGGYVIKKRQGDPDFYWCTGEVVKVGAKHCDLCKSFIESDCIECPLFITGDACAQSTSTYKKFLNNPNLKTSTKMVATMKDLLA